MRWCPDCEEERVFTFDWIRCIRCQNKRHNDAYRRHDLHWDAPQISREGC
jgi:hypothetical protein